MAHNLGNNGLFFEFKYQTLIFTKMYLWSDILFSFLYLSTISVGPSSAFTIFKFLGTKNLST
jgi:hypothetical protein